MIADLNNPVSEYYYKKSIESFSSVSDYIDIELVQCTTTETSNKELLLDKQLSPTEFACINSHYKLIKRMSQEEERFIIMEHDAFLFPDKIPIFIQLLETMHNSAIWNPGIAMECYSLSKTAAKIYCDFIENNGYNIEYGGTMEICLWVAKIYSSLYKVKSGENFLWVVDGYSNKSCYSDNIFHCMKGRGFSVPSPITQLFSTKILNTVEHIRPGKIVIGKDHVAKNMLKID